MLWSAADFMIFLITYIDFAIMDLCSQGKIESCSILLCVTNHQLSTIKTYLADVSNKEFVIAVRACVANHKATTTWSNSA